MPSTGAVPANGASPLFPDNCDTWWRSLDELADAPRFRAFLESEFPSPAAPGSISRRRVLQLMGASLALAAAGGCRWKEQEILPFTERPDGRVPGKTERFATAMPLGDTILGLEVTCIDGRPIKIEGNPRHPQSLGATNAFAQAALLELYDPDRSRSVMLRQGEEWKQGSWEEFAAACKTRFQRLRESGGAGFRVLAEAHSSPTLAALQKQLLKTFPQARWYEFEPLGDDNERAGAALALGRPLRTHLALDRARVIVCLDADPLGSHPAAVRYARDFMAGRQPEAGRMNRLYVVESGVSLSGAMADHRLALKATQIPALVAMLERELGAPATQISGTAHAFLRAVADDLRAPENRGRSVVCVGPSQAPEVHAAVHRINALLGNVGKDKTITYTSLPAPDRPPHGEAIRSLVAEMNDGKVDTLLILGGNPVYNAPADLAFDKALARVETTIHLSAYRDETSRRSTWHLPRAHFLEAWGDGRSYDGTYSVIQPMIAPLSNGRSAIEVVSMILGSDSQGAPPPPEELIQRTFRDEVAGKSGIPWRQVVRDGLMAESRWPVEAITAKSGDPAKAKESSMAQLTESPTDDGPLEIVFDPDRSMYDGRFANNSWLQEFPDPVTKLTWGNAALLSPATAKKLGLEHEAVVVLKAGDREVRIPVFVLPGQAPGTIGLPLGYGRWAAGKVGGDAPEVEPVGVNVYPLRTTASMYVVKDATITPTGATYRLACTQDHQAIGDVGREATEKRSATLIREASLKHYQKHPDFAQHASHHPPLKSLWQEPGYEGHRWGMSIDLSKCIGCGACVVACQAENNVPIVGREQVLKGREMHWLRVDRYFRGEPENPEVAYQPLPCQQCEMAPCEQVCPVAATVHSHEGLNDMVYNRCVGTRYCANNCPYKVRRFNYFNFHKDLEAADNEVAKMKYNPQVTVRSRGVMEKCTYCVQRIQAAKITSKNAGEPVRDGQVRTACQQACPTQAIVFGDLSDAKSQVLHEHGSPRAYTILAELNTKPRTAYLARIRNPNPQLESTDDKHERPTG